MITRDQLVAACRVVATAQGHPDRFHFGHLEPGEFRRLRDFFPEASIVEETGDDSRVYSFLVVDLDGFEVRAQTLEWEVRFDLPDHVAKKVVRWINVGPASIDLEPPITLRAGDVLVITTTEKI